MTLSCATGSLKELRVVVVPVATVEAMEAALLAILLGSTVVATKAVAAVVTDVAVMLAQTSTRRARRSGP